MLKTRTLVALAILAATAAAVIYVKTHKDEHARELGTSAAGAPAPVAIDDIDGLEIRQPGQPPVVLVKAEGGWKITAPVADKADPGSIDLAVKTLGELGFRDVVADSKTSHAALEIRDEDATTVTAKKGDKVLLSILVGKREHVRLPGKDQVWQVAGMRRVAFVKEAKLWRFREVFRFEADEVERLEATLGGAKIVARREAAPPPAEGAPPAPAKWTLVEGQPQVGGALDESSATSVVGTLSHLDVAEFADGVTAEAAGLTPPRALVTAVTKDGKSYGLEIGKDVEGGELTYARVVGEPRVFELNKAAADGLARPVADWRDKTLAKVNVDELKRIELDKDGEKLAFARGADQAWTVATGKVAGFDATRVNAFVGAFANLRAQSIAAVTPEDAGLVKPTGRVRLSGDKGVLVDLIVGGTAAPAGNFVQIAGKPEIYVVPEHTARRLLKGARDFAKQQAPTLPPGTPSAH
jgi:hypothetical protein